jgi:hypothetical protein
VAVIVSPPDDDEAERDIQRVLDIAYGRDVALSKLEATQDVKPWPDIVGVYRLERIHDELLYWHAPELSCK